MDINFANMSDLNRTVSGAFLDAYNAPFNPEWAQIATRIQSNSSANLYPFLAAQPGMREWLGDAIFEQLASGRYVIDNRKFQKGVEGDRDQIKDDADGGAGLYASAARLAAQACLTHPDELVIGETLKGGESLLCMDGQPYFDTAHPNVNGDGGTQSNLLGSGSEEWYVMDVSQPLKPLVYQLRESLQVNVPSDFLETLNRTHKLLWNFWLRDSAGFGPWWMAVKHTDAFTGERFKTARAALQALHLGVKDPLTGNYRPSRNRATLLVAPLSMQDTINDVFGPEQIGGTTNVLRNAIPVMYSRYL